MFLKHDIRYHAYADDTQQYVDFPRGDSASAVERVRRCVIDVKGILQPTGESIYCKIYTHCVDYPYLLCTPGSG